jgi:hypothetical protein
MLDVRIDTAAPAAPAAPASICYATEFFCLFSFCCCVISLLLLYFSSRQSLHNTGVLGFVLLFGCSLFLDGPRLLFIIGRQLQLCRSGESI